MHPYYLPSPASDMHTIVDTNVLLKQTQLRELLKVRDQFAFEELFEVVTLDSVINEIRDEQSRAYVNTGLPYNLQVKTKATFIDKKDMTRVQNFAKDTGDFSTLSLVDTEVIAMGLKIAREKNEHHLLRK